ncbi:MAG: hypothetical protein ABF315_00945 [Lentimonas sp.]
MKIKTILLAIAAAAIIPAISQAKPEGERQGGERPNPAELIKRLDTDNSGGISKEEAKGPLAKHFDKIDEDGDGEITKAEFAKASKKMRQRQKGGSPREKFDEHDADSNGSLSKDEAPERMLEHFDEIDADGNGEITKEELKAAAEARGGKKGGKGPKKDDADGRSI